MMSGISVAIRRSIAARLATLARCARSSPMTLAARAARLQLPLDEVERALGAIDEDEPARPEHEHLASQLGADGPAGTGDHHGLVAQDLVDGRGMGVAGRTAQQVGDLDAADAVGVERAVQQVVHRRHGANFEAHRHGRVDDAADAVLPGALGIVIRSALAPVVLDGARERLQPTEDPEVGDEAAGQVRIVVEEADRHDARPRACAVPTLAMRTPVRPAP